MEIEESHGTASYLVHYAGWNNRYNEWIKRARVVSVVEDSGSKPGGQGQGPTKATPSPAWTAPSAARAWTPCWIH